MQSKPVDYFPTNQVNYVTALSTCALSWPFAFHGHRLDNALVNKFLHALSQVSNALDS